MQGANQAAAAAKLGQRTVMVGQVGDDAGADFMRDALAGAGVATGGTVASVAGVSTGTAVVMVQPDGENSIVIVGGANTAEWTCEGAQRAAVEQASVVLLQRELSDDVNARFAAAARAAGVPVMLDAGGAEGAISDGLLQHVSLLSPNETELARLVEQPAGSRDDVLDAAGALRERARCDVLVKRGAQGSLLLEGAAHLS
jgi:ribokinase